MRKICLKLQGVPPKPPMRLGRCSEYPGDLFVTAQRAMLGQRYMEVQKHLAAERKSQAATASNQRRSESNPVPEDFPGPGSCGDARDKVGEMVGVSGRMISDAEQTGAIDRNRKPYLAMRAARCVELGEHGGDRRSSSSKLNLNDKCTAGEFAATSGIARNTIASYIAIYDECVNLYPDVYTKRPDMVPLHEYPFPTEDHWNQELHPH